MIGAAVGACWLLYGLGFVVNHVRVRIERAAGRGAREEGALRNRASDLGLLIEAAGAAIVYSMWNVQPDATFATNSDRVLASVFHAISAFCGARSGIEPPAAKTARRREESNMIET